MKAHIVGGGFGGLAAAALLIRNADVPGHDITIYEADEKLGGGFFLCGDPTSGYNLPGSVFDKEFRCAFDLLATIPTEAYPNISVKEQFFTFNTEHPFVDQTHIVDRELRPVHGPRFGLSWGDGFALAKLSLTPEEALDGRRIQDFFSPRFFETEFWLLWSTIMGSLPQHSLIEFRRYMNRFVYLFPDLSTMAHVLRSQFNQHEAFVKPLVAWLTKENVNFVTGAFVEHIGFAQSPGRMVVDRLDYQRDGAETSVAVAPEDIVLVTIGSQAADLSAGSMKKAPAPKNTGRSWALWKQLAKEHKCFGNPDAFFGPTSVWWGYGLYPERIGNYVTKRMGQCTGEEILEELLRHLRFSNSEAIMSSSICIPCNLPYVNNIWLPRKRGDRPPVVPDIAFTFEYSTRSAWEAIHRLLKRGPAPPPVYQGQFDPKAVWAALKVFLGLTS